VSSILSETENFSDGLKGWTYSYSGRTGLGQAEVVYDREIDSDVLEYKRWQSYADGGSTGVYQNLDVNVDECSELYLETDVKVISNWLGDSGWWSYYRGGIGEFPAHIIMTYKDRDGKSWLWTHGFLPVKDRWGRKNYDVVTRNVWYHYKSPNLVNVTTTVTRPYNKPIPSPTPAKITRIWIGGNGWDFKGRYDNVKLYCLPKVIEVPVDIKPRSCPNPLNVKARGVLPAAILGTAEFDVTQIDLATVKLEDISPLRAAFEDVATSYEPYLDKIEAPDCTPEGPDGYLDLTLKFDNQAIVETLGEVSDGEVKVLQLRGNLKPEYGGTPIIGEDVVVILKKVNGGDGNLNSTGKGKK
jgi:hypothetical protein